ncbi:hypothetical protein HK104_005036 [Borealophlyctis nickersoniae]|nr:hypothetical protein HK104_005036 [Borealophlyctis nickersoniae]
MSEEAIIRLLDSSGVNVLDSVSAEYEDSFSLETFGDMAMQHYEAEPKGTKSFIIARVQTWDHKQPEKAFYSYYSAYQLNKILFQTQVYLGKKLIHRLHVLNPLTNTDIIGNVQYFMVKVKPESAEEQKQQDNIIATAVVDEAKEGDVGEARSAPLDPEMGLGRKTIGKGNRPPPKINTSLKPTGVDMIVPPSPAVREVESGALTSWTMAAPAVTEASDEEYKPSGPGPRPRKFSLVTMGLKSPYPSSPKKKVASASKLASQDLEENPKMEGGDAEEDVDSLAMRPRAISYGTADTARRSLEVPVGEPMKARHGSLIHFQPIVKQPTGIIQMRNHKRNKTTIPVGAITRFAQPISVDELEKSAPPTTKRRRRTLSFANAVTAAGTPATFQEWIEMVRKEQRRLKAEGDRGQAGQQYDSVEPFGQRNSVTSPGEQMPMPPLSQMKGKPASESAAGLLNSKLPFIRDESTRSIAASLGSDGEPKSEGANVKVYDAVLFATDNDFLESSRIRAIFRENAVTSQDAKLFEMPPYTGVEQAPPAVVIVDDSAFCEWCYPSPGSLARYGPCMRLFHRTKCYLAAILLVVAMFCFIFFTLRTDKGRQPSTSTAS